MFAVASASLPSSVALAIASLSCVAPPPLVSAIAIAQEWPNVPFPQILF
jgi:hypothetical protein